MTFDSLIVFIIILANMLIITCYLGCDVIAFEFNLSFLTALKLSKYGVFSGPYFPVFGLNTEIYGVNLRIQSEYRKMRTRKNSVFGHFSCSVLLSRFPT